MSEDDIRFLESDFQSNSDFVEKYKSQIAIPYDDFLEDFILRSEFYSIEVGSQRCGFFGINNSRLTILFIDDLYFANATRIFEKITKTYELQDAFIPTTDISALSVVLEGYKEIKLQALHFSDTGRSARPAEFGKECFRLANMADLDEVQSLAGDFIEDYESMIAAKELFVLEVGTEIFGIGIVVRNQIMHDCLSLGVFTREGRRGLGVGRSIVLHLKEVAYGLGMTPVAGCWYYNTESRITLESAGFVTKSKLLRVVL